MLTLFDVDVELVEASNEVKLSKVNELLSENKLSPNPFLVEEWVEPFSELYLELKFPISISKVRRLLLVYHSFVQHLLDNDMIFQLRDPKYTYLFDEGYTQAVQNMSDKEFYDQFDYIERYNDFHSYQVIVNEMARRQVLLGKVHNYSIVLTVQIRMCIINNNTSLLDDIMKHLREAAENGILVDYLINIFMYVIPFDEEVAKACISLIPPRGGNFIYVFKVIFNLSKTNFLYDFGQDELNTLVSRLVKHPIVDGMIYISYSNILYIASKLEGAARAMLTRAVIVNIQHDIYPSASLLFVSMKQREELY